MNTSDLSRWIARDIEEVERTIAETGDDGLLADIVTTLKQMALRVAEDAPARTRAANGLARLVTDDVNFMKTPLAADLADLIEAYSGGLE